MKALYIERYKNNQKELKEHTESFKILKDEIDEKIKMREAQIDRLRKKREKLSIKQRETSPKDLWMAELLMEELEEKLGLVGQIYGPFGMRCETSIYLAKEGDKAKHKDVAICDVPTWSITLTPDYNVESGYRYETGKVNEIYPAGSIGDLNGFGREELPLPTDIDEIVKLLKYSGKERK